MLTHYSTQAWGVISLVRSCAHYELVGYWDIPILCRSLTWASTAITSKPTFPCWLCGNHGHAGKDCPESIHSSNSLGKCTNCQETGDYSILCTKPPKQQAPNNLNAIRCDFCIGHHYGSECNNKKESPAVMYSNRTKKTITTSDDISPMPESGNQPVMHYHVFVPISIFLPPHL